MDYINDKLSAHTRDQRLSQAIKASLQIGKNTLNQYYSLMDSSEVYHIVMGMFWSFMNTTNISCSFAPLP